MTASIRTHEIIEIERGVFWTLLVPCSVATLADVVSADTHILLVEHSPDNRLLWASLQVPLAPSQEPQESRVRSVTYDLQAPGAAFCSRVLPQISRGSGILALELLHVVPDSLRYREIMALPQRYQILRGNGWRLTFTLPHGGEYAEVTAPERSTLEELLAKPNIAAGKLAGELP